MSSARAFSLAGLLALAAAPASAGEVTIGKAVARVDVTTTTTASYHLDNGNQSSCDDDYADGIERLNVGGFLGAWTVGLRLDASVYAATPEAGSGDPPCRANSLTSRYQRRIGPEKVWVGWSGRNLEVVVGDASVSFGRGLSLSLRKIDEFGVDTTLRSVKVLLHQRKLDASFVAGATNIGNLDEATGVSIDDTHDLVGGLDLQLKPKDGVAVGAHGVLYAFRDVISTVAPDADAYEERWLVYGPTFDAPRLMPWLGVYLEGVGQRRIDSDGEGADGFGLYGTITAYRGATTVLVEGKAYGDLAVVSPFTATGPPEQLAFRGVQYTSLPTAERVLQIIANPQQDIVGARVRVDRVITPALQIHGNYGLFRDYLGFPNPEDPLAAMETTTIHDLYVGVDRRWDEARSRALFSAGARLVDADNVADLVQWDLHADYDVVYAVTDDASVEVHGMHVERREALVFGTEDWREGTLQLGFRFRPHVAVAGVLDYTTEASQTQDLYPSGNVTWDLTDSSSLRIFAGSARGGLKCVSGVCRVFPPFDGVKLTGTFRF